MFNSMFKAPKRGSSASPTKAGNGLTISHKNSPAGGGGVRKKPAPIDFEP